MDLGLKGKKVFISASSGGIGLATAEAFLREGAVVIINGRNEETLKRISESFNEVYGENIDYYCGDMTDIRALVGLKEFIESKYQGLDILVANLGTGKPLSDNVLDSDEWKRFFETNVFGTVELLNQLYTSLVNGDNPCVVLISSIVSKEVMAAPIGYASSKAAVRILNKYLGERWSKEGIRLNCVLPGNIYFKGGRWEELLKENESSVTEYIDSNVPLKRFGKPGEVADAIVFLSSDRAGYITGAELVIDGGQLRSI